ncbi:30S ribosomal protein S26e [Candidatus Bathyarchaeota archaeon]|nr:30S ribosomal protein S26e [Candidatus Bathyarchaeota archaeon]
MGSKTTRKTTRKKGQSGRAVVVQCVQCGKMVPRDKAVEKRKSTLPLDHRLRERLKKQGAYLGGGRSIVYYCVSCAKHRKYV